MGTKNNPGDHDCYERADPDEPMFVLLGRDPAAPHLVRWWAQMREREGADPEQLAEARRCADAMEQWAVDRGKGDRVIALIPAAIVRCAHCDQHITKGQEIAKVRVPSGDTVLVHGACMGRKDRGDAP